MMCVHQLLRYIGKYFLPLVASCIVRLRVHNERNTLSAKQILRPACQQEELNKVFLRFGVTQPRLDSDLGRTKSHHFFVPNFIVLVAVTFDHRVRTATVFKGYNTDQRDTV